VPWIFSRELDLVKELCAFRKLMQPFQFPGPNVLAKKIEQANQSELIVMRGAQLASLPQEVAPKFEIEFCSFCEFSAKVV
jgi:hypothetical protein